MQSRSLGHRAPLLWLILPLAAGIAAGKAFAWSAPGWLLAGAFVAAHPSVIETLVQSARSYIYTTAAPPLLAPAPRYSR